LSHCINSVLTFWLNAQASINHRHSLPCRQQRLRTSNACRAGTDYDMHENEE